MQYRNDNLEALAGKDWIYVIDLETTGLSGAPVDRVVDVGICAYNRITREVVDVYSSVLGYDTSVWSDRERHAWIFTHQGAEMTVEDCDLANAPRAEDVVEDVRRILNGKTVVSYNMEFDFNRFLLREPWNLNGMVDLSHDPMLVCRAHLSSRVMGRCSLENVYKSLFPASDPAGIGEFERHLGLPDARMAGYVMGELSRLGIRVWDA